MQTGKEKPTVDASELVTRGRECFDRREWNDAFEALSQADALQPLSVEDLDRLMWSAGLTARDDAMLLANERVYQTHLDGARDLPAARAAFWLGFRLLARGEMSRANGWLSRSQRLVDSHGADCVEQGYLLLPQSQKHISGGEWANAQSAAARAASIGARYREKDLLAFAQNLQGRALLAAGQIELGLSLLDESMVAATSDELSPVVTGIIYCSAIASCHRIYALGRVREWTARLSTWCDARPQLGMFTGHCLAHRAEILEIGGSWAEAAAEAARAIERSVRNIERDAAGRAHYQHAEIHRLRGEYLLAEAAYFNASRVGYEPQPGLALLRLAQGDRNAAANALRRIVSSINDPLLRTRYLPAFVEVMLASGDLDAAAVASSELKDIAATVDAEVLTAIAAHACGAVALATGNPKAVLEPVRLAFEFWRRLDAPYLAARLRVLLARACISLGDSDSACLELSAAREVFQSLGAKPDSNAVDILVMSLDAVKPTVVENGGLTDRELQVLRLVARGQTNKMIARELSLSEKTVDRHLSNMFAKLNVNSRAAATAFAYERHLIA
jgi:DNA-binding CsgD family transcriptional regulator